MIHRNRVTDEYKLTLGYIRRKYADLCPGLGLYEVPVRRKTWGSRWLRGGYAETFAVMDGMLLTAFLVLAGGMDPCAAVAGVALAVFLWWCASPRAKQP